MRMLETFSIDLVEMPNTAQPGNRPRRQLRPAFTYSHEVPPYMRPTERQHDQPRLHQRHGFVARVPIDFQCPRSCRAKMCFRHLVPPAAIEQIDHGVLAENHPQPPTVAFFPVKKHENPPTGLVGLMEAALPIPFAEGIVDWRQHWLDPLEPVVYRG